ncbi:MAG TPA: universal stress protein [Chitinophagaceae bacterium]|nr:universal stress protein [Chitinophagaceae bacterium]
MSHILIALDFSEFSPEVEKVGFALAKKIGASVTLVTIINKFIDYVPPDTGQVFENQWEARKDIAQKTLLAIKNNHDDVPTDIATFIGDPKEDIIRLSVERHSTFIVMGTHGRTGLSHLVMGSTAEYILRHSVIPIIVVPMNKIKFKKD